MSYRKFSSRTRRWGVIMIILASLLVAGGLVYQHWLATPNLKQYGSLAEAPLDTWVQVDLSARTRCSDGSPYHIYARRGSSANLLIHFSGGGACWDADTCAQPIGLGHLDGYYFSGFLAQRRAILGGIFEAENPANPLRDWSVVYIPYCTADLHIGNAQQTFIQADGSPLTIFFNGRQNTLEALDFAGAAFPQPERLLLSGDSAGGIAAALWASLVAERYPETQLTQLSDGASLVSEHWPQIVDEVWRADPRQTFGFEVGSDLIASAYQAAERAQTPITFLSINTLHDSTLPKFEARLNQAGDPRGYASTWTQNMLKAEAQAAASQIDFAYYLTDYGYQEASQTTPHTLIPYAVFYKVEQGSVKLADWLQKNLFSEERLSIGSDFIK